MTSLETMKYFQEPEEPEDLPTQVKRVVVKPALPAVLRRLAILCGVLGALGLYQGGGALIGNLVMKSGLYDAAMMTESAEEARFMQDFLQRSDSVMPLLLFQNLVHIGLSIALITGCVLLFRRRDDIGGFLWLTALVGIGFEIGRAVLEGYLYAGIGESLAAAMTDANPQAAEFAVQFTTTLMMGITLARAIFNLALFGWMMWMLKSQDAQSIWPQQVETDPYPVGNVTAT